ncbi:hypothetical protein DJFAAGMI_01271 [Comamonas sp. PE63]|uniref:Uncharacterized protein n=1 Tax=Comamonas brasiliensis TaxID=1812482 RepID=A0ABS5LPX0_9BURK|nr:DUF6246 family protein [Comamonas sp. PE63]MBS3018539.1 hypothetical protein [Comamonas sp. PE63]
MLIEHGYSRVVTANGLEFTFTPSFARIAQLGHPGEIVDAFRGLFGPRALFNARYVLAVLCDQDDATALLGWQDEDGEHEGNMPVLEQISLAAHLMRHGLVGSGGTRQDGSSPVTQFHVAEYVAAARIHLGLSTADAEALSMSEFQALFEMKYPQSKSPKRDVPTREEYRAAMEAIERRRDGQNLAI